MTTTTFRPATPKQIAFILRLDGERNTPVAGRTPEEARILENISDAGTGKALSTREASACIEYLLAAPRAEQEPSQAPQEAKEGYYLSDGTVYLIVRSKSSGKPYAKRLDFTTTRDGKNRATWTYAPGTARILAGAEPLTQEQAAALGHKYGICIICGKTLTDDTNKGKDGLTSIQRGIGPVCAERLA